VTSPVRMVSQHKDFSSCPFSFPEWRSKTESSNSLLKKFLPIPGSISWTSTIQSVISGKTAQTVFLIFSVGYHLKK
ncbi:hypothetical protein, partial [Methanospirillum sp.]|uniref:hypothetical protein n=1 Tax=Methanospirillum sp. TaxID=45200 RepID=UPI002C7C1D78